MHGLGTDKRRGIECVNPYAHAHYTIILAINASSLAEYDRRNRGKMHLVSAVILALIACTYVACSPPPVKAVGEFIFPVPRTTARSMHRRVLMVLLSHAVH